MSVRVFLDTNVFVYLVSGDDPMKKSAAAKVLDEHDCAASIQVLNEICNVLSKKFKKDTASILATVQAIEQSCLILDISIRTVESALDIHERYSYSYYDSLILASALQSNCRYIVSEDLQHGQTIEGLLTIVNIFANPKYETSWPDLAAKP